MVKNVERHRRRHLEREADFFAAIRKRVESGELVVHYLVGNHDRLLLHAPAARARGLARADRHATTLELHKPSSSSPTTACSPTTATSAIRSTSTPTATRRSATRSAASSSSASRSAVRQLAGADHPGLEMLDDIDDVRPVYAVPAWVRQVGGVRRELLRPISQVWGDLVEEFLDNDFVSPLARDQRKRAFAFDLGKKLRLLLELSRSRIMARAHDERMTQLYRVLQHAFDGKMSTHGAERAGRAHRPALRGQRPLPLRRRCGRSARSAAGRRSTSTPAPGAPCTRSATTSAAARASCPTTR